MLKTKTKIKLSSRFWPPLSPTINDPSSDSGVTEYVLTKIETTGGGVGWGCRGGEGGGRVELYLNCHNKAELACTVWSQPLSSRHFKELDYVTPTHTDTHAHNQHTGS